MTFNEKHNQPFYVGIENKRDFRGVRNGYLPTIEEEEIIKVDIPQEAPDWIKRLWYKQNQLEARVLHYQKLVQRLIAKEKSKDII